MNPLDVVNTYYAILSEKKGEGLENIVAEDIIFDDPMTKASGAKDFIYYTKKWAGNDIAFKMIKQTVNNDEVCSQYVMGVATPSGMLNLDVADFIQVRDGKIAKEKVYFDARELVKAFAPKEQ